MVYLSECSMNAWKNMYSAPVGWSVQCMSINLQQRRQEYTMEKRQPL